MDKQAPALRQIHTWQDAELNAAAWMRHWGYPDAVAVPGGADGGIDVRARRALGQVKFQGAPVGRPALQQLVGARMRTSQMLFFFTGSNYSKTACEYADQMGIALMRYDPWGRMTPVNAVAARVAPGTAAPVEGPTGDSEASRVTPRTPIRAHVARHWAAWLGGCLLLAPFGSMGDTRVYTGPAWLDAVKFVGVLLLMWTLAGALLVLWRVQQRRRPS